MSNDAVLKKGHRVCPYTERTCPTLYPCIGCEDYPRNKREKREGLNPEKIRKMTVQEILDHKCESCQTCDLCISYPGNLFTCLPGFLREWLDIEDKAYAVILKTKSPSHDDVIDTLAQAPLIIGSDGMERNKPTPKLLYISGPFSDDDNLHGVARNIILASEAALQGWRQRWVVICPHKNTDGFQWATDIPHDVWVDGDIEILKHCDAICMLPGWKDSKGACQEHTFAVDNGLEILYYLNGVIVDYATGEDAVFGNVG